MCMTVRLVGSEDAEMSVTAEQVRAAINGGCLGKGYSARLWSPRDGGKDRVYVTRYARQERGYITLDDDGETIDLGHLDIAGMSDDSVVAALRAHIGG